jgi:hypothetical protein
MLLLDLTPTPTTGRLRLDSPELGQSQLNAHTLTSHAQLTHGISPFSLQVFTCSRKLDSQHSPRPRELACARSPSALSLTWCVH